MLVDEKLLFRYGGELLNFKKNEVIFREAEIPRFYFQIQYGDVKINNYHEEGRESIHSFPSAGHCLDETFLFVDKSYPVNAIAMNNTSVIRVEIRKFFELIHNDKISCFKFISILQKECITDT